jgi:lipoprotein-anchoring transpeptidase ErfK/SrfK
MWCRNRDSGMRNEDVIDLYGRVPVGAKVVVI